MASPCREQRQADIGSKEVESTRSSEAALYAHDFVPVTTVIENKSLSH